MKHVGIVDITTVGACICANELVTESNRRNSSGNHPEFTIHSFPFSLYYKYLDKQDWSGMGQMISDSINKLRTIGANFIIIPSNTPHYAINEIMAKSLLPVLNLIELVANECVSKGYKTALILGTKQTMFGGLYEQYLIKKNINSVMLSEKEGEILHSLILNHIIPLKKDRFSMAEKINADILSKYSCDVIILGCTELPEVYNSAILTKPVIDTTRLLAHKALDYCLLLKE